MTKPESKEKKFLKKHPPLTDEQVKQSFREADKAKQDYTKDMNEIQQNIMGFHEVLDPIIDPQTNKCLGWMRRPLNTEVEKYYDIYTDKETDPKQQRQRQYQIMSDLIVIPNQKPEWWRENTSPWFAKLFAVRLELFFEQLGVTMENFQQAT